MKMEMVNGTDLRGFGAVRGSIPEFTLDHGVQTQRVFVVQTEDSDHSERKPLRRLSVIVVSGVHVHVVLRDRMEAGFPLLFEVPGHFSCFVAKSHKNNIQESPPA